MPKVPIHSCVSGLRRNAASFLLGYWLAKKIGLWRSVALFVAVEVVMLWWMRDNLLLNVLMLLWPIDAIRRWQQGGG